jgi:hypothetical protein
MPAPRSGSDPDDAIERRNANDSDSTRLMIFVVRSWSRTFRLCLIILCQSVRPALAILAALAAWYVVHHHLIPPREVPAGLACLA